MSAGFLRRSSTPTTPPANNLTLTSDKPSTVDDEEWHLKIALELSAKSYEMEQTRRRSTSVSPRMEILDEAQPTAAAAASKNKPVKDLIDWDDPRMAERKKKIDDILKVQKQMESSSKNVRSTAPTYGFGSSGTASIIHQSYNTTISGGGRAYGMSKTASTPTFSPMVYFTKNVPDPANPESASDNRSSSDRSSSSVPQTSVKWRPRPEKIEAPFRLPPPPQSTNQKFGTAAIYWRKNNNLVIPYVKSTIFPDNPSDDDNLIQFMPSDPAGCLSSEELLKIFDPLFSKPPAIEDEPAKRQSTMVTEKIPSSVVSKSAVEVRSKSMAAESGKPRTESLVSENSRNSTGSTRPRSYQPPPIPATSWEDIRLIDGTSVIERQLKRLCESVLKSERSSEDDVWRDVIIARRVRYPLPSATDVMLVIRTDSARTPTLKFTCDVASSVDQVLAMVLFNSDHHLQGQNSYALKVFGRDEYFLPQSLLSDYAYVHNSIKLGKDILLQLEGAPKEKAKTPEFNGDGLGYKCFSSVQRKDLEVVLQTIKTEVRRVQDAARSGGSVQCTPVIQAIKALCMKLHNVEIVELNAAINKFSAACDGLSGGSKVIQHRDVYNGNDQFRKSSDYLPDLDRAIELLANAVHGLLAAFCRSSNVSFSPAPIGRRPSLVGERKEFMHLEDSFLCQVGSVHNLQSDWLNAYAKFYVSAYVFHGVNEVFKKERAALAIKEHGLYPFLKVDTWVTFDNSHFCTLPRESRLCVVLYGIRVETNDGADLGSAMKSIVEVQIGWCCMPLFDSENCLLQGTYLVPMVLDSTIQPWGPPSYIGDVNRASPVLAVTLPAFDHEIRFPDDVPVAPERTIGVFEQLDVDTRQALEGIFESAANVKELASDEKDLLWEKRFYLTKKPEALPLVLSSVFSWDCLVLSLIYQMLELWSILETAQAIELLLPRFPDKEVRRYALQSVRKSGADELLGYLPQFVEALQFELYEDSALAQLLLQFAKENRRFAFALFWLLEERKGSSLYGCRCGLLQNVMLRLLGKSVASEMEAQLRTTMQTDGVATELKTARDEDRSIILRTSMERLDSYLLENHVRLPLNPSVVAVGIDIPRSTYFNSMTVPMKIVYRSLNSSFEVLHKIGDDLRQDALVMQMIRLMNDVWLKEGLDLRIITFHCLPTGRCRGMVEMVLDSKTLREITDEGGGVAGVLREDLTWRWIQKHNSSELDYEMALKNFRLSCAGWCVATYVLGIGDRHNDNVLVTSRGHMLHIDFGKYLGDTQTFGGFKRDRTPFLLTSDMVNVINAGDNKATAHFQEFVDNCCLAFNILRRNNSLFVNLMKLMVCSGIPGLSMDAVEYISQNFCMGYSESKASEYFTRMIEETMKSSFPKWNFLVHALAQQRKPAPASNSDQLLSFVPHRYTEGDLGRITHVDVADVQKWHMPEKVYMYKIQVTRERFRDPFFIYRSYKEFCEFYDMLHLRFPLVKLYGLSRSQNLGRTNIREVADRRRIEISMFLETVFRASGEVIHCDLVYTFFHSTLRDQETDGIVRDGAPPRNQSGTPAGGLANEIQGKVRVALEYRQGKLEVFISHVKDLPLGVGGTPPDVYVKTYLRPGHSADDKRKTRIVQKSQNPTFNVTLEYNHQLAFFMDRQLEVTVWRRDVLKENAFLGGVLIPLDCLDRPIGHKIERWYELENIRRGRW